VHPRQLRLPYWFSALELGAKAISGRRRDASVDGRLGRRLEVDLAAGKPVLVTAHGNSLRALVKHLDGISDDAIAELNIPTGIPLVYELDEGFVLTGPGQYLDPEAAAAGAAAVAAQGKK
jgi:broad specificity phosphatase PhoE